MAPRSALSPLLALAAICVAPWSVDLRAAEPWADARLPVKDGLELWLDAGRLNAARQAQGQVALKTGEAVETWPDASGSGRHVRQETKAKQPRFLRVGDDWLLRFDGDNDYLRCLGSKRSLDAFTVFLVAAPRANPGDFRGFLAANEPGRRDYETGFTIDMNFETSDRFEQVNVEGRGFGGARNLLNAPSPFGALHILEAVADPKQKKVHLVCDGTQSGERPFTPSALHFDELTVGARYYTNGPGAQQVRGFLPGDLIEVLIYNRVLTIPETKSVRDYLERKHARLKTALAAQVKPLVVGQPLVRVADPPPVQMLIPGFTVRRLPLELTNINNVKYRPDGKLVALAYNGDIHLLSDSDGDGLEDRAELFWQSKGRLRGPIGMALTPTGYKHGNGVFVSSKGKVSLIVDSDGDDKADKEIIVAQGWKEIPQAVDALGVTLDRDGSLYFALGTADFSNAYLIDKDGQGHYDIKSDRGTVQKVSPDFKKRETICTGVRFPVAMAFNRHGDLFCTEQEGATWLPNGNPFDELLHIQRGRHYGFPPRHPRHLPGVLDEPSVYDYGPQHQSTCGLNFNEPVNGGPIFGPKAWAGDALICGESRGKIYRTQLVKTPAGYVAQNHLLARLNMLTIDACVASNGDLVVTTHSGPPDWGTGPNGKGSLYKIAYTGRETPQPVAVWSSSLQEVRIAFDRPLDPQHLKNLAAQTKITYGKYVRAGDRFESLQPPYAVVQMQMRTPRFDLPVYGAKITSDHRTLLLATAPQRQAIHYAVMLPGLGRLAKPAAKEELPQHPQIDLAWTLTGVNTRWQPKSSGPSWSGWLPHIDLAVAKAFTAGSASHDELWELLRSPGTLTLNTRLDLLDMLRPTVQVGAKIDHEWPPERVTVTLTASCPFSLRDTPAKQIDEGHYQTSLTVNPKKNETIPVEIVLTSAGGVPKLDVAWHTAEDTRPRPLPLRRFLLPWAETTGQSAETVLRRDIPELKGGSWSRGRKLFFSEQAACSKCHTLHGQGGRIGPDLSNLVHRDYESVLRDVTEPSFAINPDYIPYLVTLKSGRTLTGSLRTEGDKFLLGDEKGQETVLHRSEVEELQPAAKSIMPEGLPKQLGAERMRDLLTFLLTEPPHMPLDAKEPPPPPRTRAEVQAILAGAPKPPGKTRPLHIVLVAGKKDHGPGEHDYPAWQKAWAELLAAADGAHVATAWEWPSADEFRTADVIVFYQRGTWTPERARAIDGYLARGGGLVYIHWAVDGGADAPGFAQRIGLASVPTIRFRHGPLDLGFETGARHPIARNFDKIHFHDESYWQLIGDPKRIRLLASSVEDGQPRPQFWTLEPDKGRVFVSIPGHYSWTFDDPLYRILLLRGIAWTAKEPVDRFNELVFIGARMAD